jgi:hypothetical protein
MIKLKFNGEEYEVRNQLDEIKIGEFEDLCVIFNNEKESKIERWSNIFNILGVPIDVIDEMDAFDFINIIKTIKIFNNDNIEIPNKLTVNGKDYISFDEGEKFKLTVKENSIIEKYIQNNSDKYIGEILSVCYKLEGSDKSIWYDKSHLDYKAKLFRDNITTDKIIGLLRYLTLKLVEENNIMNDDITK